MNKQEADILLALAAEPFVNQRLLSERTGHSLGVVNRSLRTLTEGGYLTPDADLTDKAGETLAANAPRSAILLAAGLGMRMAPINTLSPKPMLRVKGDVLVERLIRQLHEAGVFDITVVVGFMKECFDYLIDEYDVRLVVNPEYAAKNNLVSLALAADRIANTYIVPCDIRCEENPFHRQELYSWYMVTDRPDAMSEVRVNRKMELAKTPPHAGGNKMIGISYLAADQSETVRRKLRAYAADPAYSDKFWEETLYEKDRMIVYARVVPASETLEINTYEQLCELESGADRLQPEALKTIASALGCGMEEIADVRLLKKGVSNRSFLFRVGGVKYVMRVPVEGTDQLIDRAREAEAYRAIRGASFCDDPIYLDPGTGYKITRYIEGVRCCDAKKEEDLRACMRKLQGLHASGLSVAHTFDLMERMDFYENLWRGRGSIYGDYQKTKENCKRLLPFIERHRGAFCLTHIDAGPENFLFDPHAEGERGVQLIDWEYAAMQDPHLDVAMFAINANYDRAQADRLIDLYFQEGGCDLATRAKIYCYVAVCGLIWSNWCEYQRDLGVEFGEYSLRQYRYGKDFFRYAAELMEELGEPLSSNPNTK